MLSNGIDMQESETNTNFSKGSDQEGVSDINNLDIDSEQTMEISSQEIDRLRKEIVLALKTVYDPEIPVDIYELGLIYTVDIDNSKNIKIEMTLTAPGCPVAGEMPIWVRDAVKTVDGIGEVDVDLVFDPPWDMSQMSDEARLMLNMF